MSNTSPLMDLLFAGTRQKVLAQVLLQPDASFHLRELARLTDSHAGTLARELDKLSGAGLLLRTEQGNQVRYRANRDSPLFDDLASMFRKTHGAAAVLREALAPLAARIRIALVFGSIARGTQSAGSDIDLLVVGDAGFAELMQAIYPAQETLGREINPVLYSADEFAQRARQGEAFVREITAKPVVFLMGDKDDLGELAGDPAPAAARH